MGLGDYGTWDFLESHGTNGTLINKEFVSVIIDDCLEDILYRYCMMIVHRIGINRSGFQEIFPVGLRWDFGDFRGTLGTSETSETKRLVNFKTAFVW